MPETRHIHAFAGFEVDTARVEVRRDGSPIPLTRKEFELLALLATRAPAAVTKDEILRQVWSSTAIEEGTLTKTVSRLRSSLGPTGATLIGTVTGVGYRLDAAVEHRLPPTPAVVAAPIPAPAATAPPPPTRSVGWPVWLALGVAVIAALGWWLTPSPSVTAGPSLSLTGWFGDVAIAPRGTLVAVVRQQVPGGPGRIEVYDGSTPTPVWVDTASLDEDTGARALAWTPDGQRLGYVRGPAAAPEWVIATPSATAPAPEVRPLPAALSAASSAAWHSTPIVIIGGLPGSGLMEWSLNSGAIRALTRPPATATDTTPTISPDGARLAFVRVNATGEGDVYTVSMAGGNEHSLTDDDSVVTGITWAASGDAVLFSSTRSGRASGGLWRVGISGGTIEAIAPEVARAAMPVQGDGRLSYVERYRDANLYLRRGDTPWEVIFDSPDDEHSPALSPDGTRIAFISSRTGAEEVWVGALDAVAPKAITAIGGAGVGSPRWSPDGRWIAFDATPSGDGNIFVIPADGGSPRQITRMPTHDVLPSWSPDGRWLYFRSNRDDASRLYRVPVTDAGPSADTPPALVADETIWEAHPGSDHLFFTRQLDGRGLFMRPSDRGPSTMVPGTADVIPWRSWTVAGDVSYYVSEPTPGLVTLSAINPDDREPRVLWRGGWSRLRGYPSLAVSADGTRVVLARADERLRIYRR